MCAQELSKRVTSISYWKVGDQYVLFEMYGPFGYVVVFPFPFYSYYPWLLFSDCKGKSFQNFVTKLYGWRHMEIHRSNKMWWDYMNLHYIIIARTLNYIYNHCEFSLMKKSFSTPSFISRLNGNSPHFLEWIIVG